MEETSDNLGQAQKTWLRKVFLESYLTENNTIAKKWLGNLICTYLERDVPQLGFRAPAARLRRLWTMLAHLQGENVNFSKLGGNLEIDGKNSSPVIWVF